MSSQNLIFIQCDKLRELFNECRNDINKRILILDVRNAKEYNRSHLTLDQRNNIDAIRRKMRVINIDPDSVKICTTRNIMWMLSQEDLNIFKKRKDATDVIIIDSNSDNINEMLDPKSKVMRLINGLTKYDNQVDERIVVPIQVLKGGFVEWLIKYPHFTTDPTYNYELPSFSHSPPRAAAVDGDTPPMPSSASSPHAIIAGLERLTIPESLTNGLKTTTVTNLVNGHTTNPMSVPQPSQSSNSMSASVPVTQTHGIQEPDRNTKPAITKNAPGTAVPVTPLRTLRTALLRSHSSPNVAQVEGDEPEDETKPLLAVNEKKTKLDDFLNTLSSYVGVQNERAINYKLDQQLDNDHSESIEHQQTTYVSRPRFDRNLKPLYNVESLNRYKNEINFGRCPEASGRVITGLQNLGNTCFMNSVIQCIAYAPQLVSYFCSDVFYNQINFNSKYGTNGELAIEFGALVEKLNSHLHRYLEPKSFREAIVKHIGFEGCEQQDSHEFMMMLFDKLHHDLNIHTKSKLKEINGAHEDDANSINTPRATLGYQFWKKHLLYNKSIISDTFEGIFMSTLTCTACESQSNTFEVFNCLSLPIPSENRCHLKDCLSSFSRPERIEAAWECPRCKLKREAIKKIVICKLPKILIIHLKRFSQDGRWRQKLQTTIDFPLNDLNVDYANVLPQSAYGTKQLSQKNSYNLYAVVNHYGHLDGGHYTAFCKLEDRQAQRWYTFDDSNVSEMKESDVCAQSAYILFYILGF